MKPKGCGCRRCRYGLHISKWEHAKTRNYLRGGRQKVKRLIKSGEYDNLPLRIPIGYTD